MKYPKKIKSMFAKLKILLVPIYNSLIYGYPINYFNAYLQYVFFQINNIYCCIFSNKCHEISFLCEIKNLLNELVKLYTIYIDCGNTYFYLDDNYSIQRLCLTNCQNNSKINFIAQALNNYNQIILIINNLICCFNKK